MVAEAVHEGWLGRDELSWRISAYGDGEFVDAAGEYLSTELQNLQPLCLKLGWLLAKQASPLCRGAPGTLWSAACMHLHPGA